MSTPYLRRYDTTVLRDKSQTDSAQVPADASIAIYREGATVTAQTPISPGTPAAVPVSDLGAFAVGDAILVDGNASSLTVSAINTDQPTTLTASTTDQAVTLFSGSRLNPASRPNWFADPLGAVPLGATINTDPATGRAGGYLREKALDASVSGVGFSNRLYPDVSGAFVSSLTGWLNAMQYDSIQAAIDALPDSGGVVFIPRGRHVLSAGLVINKTTVTLVGEGPATVLCPPTPDAFDLITVNVAECRIYDLCLDGTATQQNLQTGKSCLVINGNGVSGHLVLNCIVRNVQCTNASKYGMWLRDTITSIFIGCDFSYNRGQGVQQEFVGDGAVALHFYCCTFSHNGSRGFLSPNCVALSFTNCSFSGNNLLGGAGSGAAEGSNFQMTNGNAITFNTCEFGQPGSNVENLVFLIGMSGPCAIYACNFDGGYIGGGPGQGAYAQRGLRTSASPGGQNVILLGCHWSELAAVSTPAGAVADIDGLGAVVGAHAFDSSVHSILLESADGVQLKGGAFARGYSTLPNPSSVQVGTIAYLSVAGQGRIAVRVPNGWHTLQPF